MIYEEKKNEKDSILPMSELYKGWTMREALQIKYLTFTASLKSECNLSNINPIHLCGR